MPTTSKHNLTARCCNCQTMFSLDRLAATVGGLLMCNECHLTRRGIDVRTCNRCGRTLALVFFSRGHWTCHECSAKQEAVRRLRSQERGYMSVMRQGDRGFGRGGV